jgi:hypothetical protein
MAHDYDVTGQKRSIELSDDGSRFEHVWKVSYQVKGSSHPNIVSHVTVPLAGLDADTVHDKIRSQINTANSIAFHHGR